LGEMSGVNEQDLFDEAAYLRLHPDVAKAIALGHTTGAWQHYDGHGRSEGRKINDFDAEYYPGSYPAVAAEIAAGRAVTPFEHYRNFGRARGFRSNPDEIRRREMVDVRCPRRACIADVRHRYTTSHYGGEPLA
jgi:hypothetical protein